MSENPGLSSWEILEGTAQFLEISRVAYRNTFTGIVWGWQTKDDVVLQEYH